MANTLPDKFLKPYDPDTTEAVIYAKWEKSGYFNPDNGIKDGIVPENAPYFSMVLPPPNATDKLHVGGALMLVIEDIIVRFHRMLGEKTLWIPGTDHAAIATHSKVEKILDKETGKSRHDIGREAFVKKVEEFVENNRDMMKRQMPATGASLDWSREAFTLDEERSRAVRTAFKRMYDAGLLYRGTRVINWDPKGQTAVSDDEIVYKEGAGRLYTFKYSKDFPIAISTTRPETKVGDTAVAVHPDDRRYKEYIGKEHDVAFAGTNLHIKVVPSPAVDPEYGTGALGVTPAHSKIDEDIAKEHGLPSIQVINEYAKMTDAAGPLVAGKKTREAREIVVEWLRSEGLLEDEKDVPQNISTADRTGGVIEPLPKLQWFIDVNKKIQERGGKTLKELMYDSVKNGAITILPDRFEKTYFDWIEKLHDWNVSRQIWYGHRLPVWYRGEEVYVGIEPPKEKGWVQDEDTLDTWFSSGLWTFTTLGWPKDTRDLKEYHPTTLLETGYDILFFWVARMILMSQFLLGEIPFKTVYLHGLVRDEKGQKISKSLGNNIDPLDVIQKYGADALRMALIVGVGPGSDTKLSYEKINAYKKFANKMWNGARFVLSNMLDFEPSTKPELTQEDEQRLLGLKTVISEVTKHLEAYRFDLAADTAYHYFWHTFADVIIEESKSALNGDDVSAKRSAQWTLYVILTTMLKLLHPFMPFVTEAIWADLPQSNIKKRELLMVEPWPREDGI